MLMQSIYYRHNGGPEERIAVDQQKMYNRFEMEK